MYKIEPKQTTFVYGPEVFEKLIPGDHILRKVNEAVDFSFANRECADRYCDDNGRPVTNFPELMFRAAFIQYYYGLSDRKLDEEINLNVAKKWFVGYNIDDGVFHFTALSKFRGRLGEEKFRLLFDRILEQIIAYGLVTKNEKQYIDATHMIADIAIPTTTRLIRDATEKLIDAVRSADETLFTEMAGEFEFVAKIESIAKQAQKDYKLPEEERKKNLVQAVKDALGIIDWIERKLAETGMNKECKEKVAERIRVLRQILNNYVERRDEEGERFIERKEKGSDRIVSTVDEDARWGAKSDKKKFVGYKVHTNVTKDHFITDIEVTPGNGMDDEPVEPKMERQRKVHGLKPEKLVGDGIYGTVGNRKILKEQGTQLVAPQRSKRNPRKGYSVDMFIFDSEKMKITCPEGHTTDGFYRNEAQKHTVFHFSGLDCMTCRKKAECTKADHRTVSIPDDYILLKQVDEYNATEDYKQDRNERASTIEPKHAEMKRFHRMERAIYRGLKKVTIQALMTAIVVNIKRLVKLLSERSPKMLDAG